MDNFLSISSVEFRAPMVSLKSRLFYFLIYFPSLSFTAFSSLPLSSTQMKTDLITFPLHAKKSRRDLLVRRILTVRESAVCGFMVGRPRPPPLLQVRRGIQCKS